ILTLFAGVALGWLLRDRFSPPVATPHPAAQPTPAPSLAAAPTAVPPNLAPTAPRLPTALPAPAAALPTSIPSPSLTPKPAPTRAPAAVAPADYAGHVVEQGETLATIAARGGSTPDLIARYNLLEGVPPPGRMLI